jgi:anti-anti-sigma regulatory factor
VSRVEPGVVHVSGVVDAATVPVFAAALATCEDDPCIQALDLSAVEFFCSAGLWCFVDRGWPIQPHVSIIASPAVRRVLTICDMEFLLARHGWRAACA